MVPKFLSSGILEFFYVTRYQLQKFHFGAWVDGTVKIWNSMTNKFELADVFERHGYGDKSSEEARFYAASFAMFASFVFAGEKQEPVRQAHDLSLSKKKRPCMHDRSRLIVSDWD